MSHHREALVFALLGFIVTMTLSVPPIIAAHIEKADRIEAYERSFAGPTEPGSDFIS